MHDNTYELCQVLRSQNCHIHTCSILLRFLSLPNTSINVQWNPSKADTIGTIKWCPLYGNVRFIEFTFDRVWPESYQIREKYLSALKRVSTFWCVRLREISLQQVRQKINRYCDHGLQVFERYQSQGPAKTIAQEKKSKDEERIIIVKEKVKSKVVRCLKNTVQQTCVTFVMIIHQIQFRQIHAVNRI